MNDDIKNDIFNEKYNEYIDNYVDNYLKDNLNIIEKYPILEIEYNIDGTDILYQTLFRKNTLKN